MGKIPIVLLLLCFCFCGIEADENCMYLTYLPADLDYKMYWNFSEADNFISFRISANYIGWLGIAFQPSGITGAMGPGDFNVGWVGTTSKYFSPSSINDPIKATVPIVQDRFLDIGFGLPVLDTKQNLMNISAYNTATGTVIEFSRPLTTGDPQDLDLENYGTDLSILFAWGESPAADVLDPTYHGVQKGRITHVDLFGVSTCGSTPSTCPNRCSGHGVCDESTSTCVCDKNWLEYDCSVHDLSQVRLLPGFNISYYAAGVAEARQLCLSLDNPSIVYVGSRLQGNVYAVVDKNGDGKADTVTVIISLLNQPNGVAWHNGSLYVAEADRIIRFDSIDTTYAQHPKYTVVLDNIPTANGNWHAWKFIRIGPDGKLYVPVGAPCNYCLRSDGPGDPAFNLDMPYDTITRMNLDGSNWEIVAKGIRNSVGLDFHPVTGQLWFSDNGRDYWDEVNFTRPSDEINVITAPNQHFGFPFCYGYGDNNATGGADTQFFNGSCTDPAAGFTPAAYEIGPHVASTGLMFYTGKQFPTQFFNQLIVCEHGSWDRPPGHMTGYKLVVLTIDSTGQKVVSEQTLAEGFLNDDNQTYWARPSAVIQLPDGSILFSDDYGGALYRITYSG